MSKFGGGIGAPSKEERLKAAAEIHLRLGQIQRYCELMVELGEVNSAFPKSPYPAMPSSTNSTVTVKWAAQGLVLLRAQYPPTVQNHALKFDR